jgi:arabinoxylan arabinofuranohydrolase
MKIILNVIFGTLLGLFGVQVQAQNPIVQTMYTADPAPMVHNGKVYLYTGHDEDNSSWFVMNNWKLYTTEDMVNWTDQGAVASYKIFNWAKGDAWALQVVEKNGKFYMYAPIINKANNNPAIGVAVADNPYGPFIDPLGKPLAQSGKGDIDPTVFIDSDGQAYLYWGNPFCYYVKLNEDMISFAGEINKVPMTEEAFGKREGNVKDRPTSYEEGPWLYKRNDLYYLFWAGGPLPEFLGYSTSKSPLGPWKTKGTIMPAEGRSFTNHPGVIDFKGKTYLFYHNGALPGGNGFNRSVCVQEMEFDKDGTIKPMKMETGISKSLLPLNPYRKTEAETMAFSEDVKAAQNTEIGSFVNAMKSNAYTKIKEVDFGNMGASKFTARVGTTHNAGITMEVRLDTKDGPLLTTIKVPITGGDDRWALLSADVPKTTGIHDLYFVFKGDNKQGRIMYFDYWMFSK